MMASNGGGSASAATATGPPVWDRLWHSLPPLAKDKAVLERERRCRRWQRTCEIIRQRFGSFQNLRTIEMGSGRGDFSVLMASEGASVTLLDYSTKALEQARRRFDRLGLTAQYVQGDLLGELNGLSNRFDLSVSLGVIEHFRGWQRTRVIGAHHRVLKEGGLTMISVPHAWCPPYRLWKMLLEIPQWWPYGLEIPYSKKELTRRAREVGFEGLELDCTDFRRSLGDMWGRGVFRCTCAWADGPSWLDRFMGVSLQLYGWRSA